MLKNKTLHGIFFGLFLLMGQSMALFGSAVDESHVTERIGVFVRDLKICHQEEWRNLSLELEYESDLSGKRIDPIEIKETFKEFLANYSAPRDFWEVMNLNLIATLTKKFPEIHNLRSILSLKPDQMLIFPRKSTVLYDRSKGIVKESFQFTKLNYLICNETFQSLDLIVAFDLKDNPVPADYPDYRWVDQAMERFFAEHPISLSKWQDIKPLLEAFILKEFPTLTKVEIELRISK